MSILIHILLSSAMISAISLVGALTLAVKRIRRSVIKPLIAFAAGTLMGGAFIHLLPEGLENISPRLFGIVFLIGFSLFFLTERILRWHHCRETDECVKTVGKMNLLGDALHNVTDGIILAATFMTDTTLGVVTALAIAFHEIPQEIGDFGVLLYSGYRPKKALLLNYLVSLTIFMGAIPTFYLGNIVTGLVPVLIPISASSFVYIAASDILPELNKEYGKESALLFVCFLIGIGLMYAITLL